MAWWGVRVAGMGLAWPSENGPFTLLLKEENEGRFLIARSRLVATKGRGGEISKKHLKYSRLVD